MSNHLNLISGKKYKVIQAFTDFDGRHHPVGETWEYISSSYFPYDDGTMLNVLFEGNEKCYRLCGLEDDQRYIVDHLREFIEPC